MASPEPRPDPLQIALGVLGAFPCQVFVISASRSWLPSEIFGVDGQCLRCARWEDAHGLGDELTVVVGDGRRAGYEIDCVASSPGDESSVPVRVVDVRRVKPRRRYARAGVSESGVVRSGGGQPEFDVRVVDIGSDGFGFVSDRPLVTGDSVSGMLNVARRAFPIHARVVHVTQLGFGRIRIGCQFTQIAESNRELLARIATEAPIDRRGLRPIELVENLIWYEDSPQVSLGDVRYHYEELRVPTLRYCRPCGRITVHRNTAPPGGQPEWQCPNCQS